MNSCSICQKPYVPSPRLGVDIPDCQCARQRTEAELAKERVAQRQEHAEELVAKLRLGILDDSARQKPDIEGWEDPRAAILEGKNLCIAGAVGNLKTTALKQIAYHAVLGGLKVRGGLVVDVMAQLKDFDHDAKDYSRWLEGGHVLLLDDLDKMLATQFEVERLFYHIDRYRAYNRSIVFTMNSTQVELQRKLASVRGLNQEKEAEAIISRLMGRTQVVTLNGADWRK